jgi:hypothetical protein
MMDRQAQFQRRRVVTTVVMLIGISLMVIPHVVQVAVPSWWKPMTTRDLGRGPLLEEGDQLRTAEIDP